MHAFSSCGASSGSLFKVLREKLELKAPQERSDEEIEAKPVESAVWSETKFLNINVHVDLKCSCFLSEFYIMKLIQLYDEIE